MPASPQPPAHRVGRPKLHPLETAVTRRRVGDANPRGRLKRLSGRFKLAEGLDAPGTLPISDAVALITAEWERQVAAGTVSATCIHNYNIDTATFARRAEATGLIELRDINTKFVYEWSRLPSFKRPGEPPAVNTRRKRIASARALFSTAQVLGLHDLNPAQGVDDPLRADRYVNAFTTQQVEQLKRVATHTARQTRVPAALSLLMLGASVAEISAARVGDIELVHQRVWLHDGGYRSRARWVPIDDPWCHDALTDRISVLSLAGDGSAEMPLCVLPTSNPAPHNRTASLNSAISKLLKRARVYQLGVTRVESIREYVALRVFAETGRLEAVATRLGMASLDTAAHIVGLDWTKTYGIDAPPPDFDHQVEG